MDAQCYIFINETKQTDYSHDFGVISILHIKHALVMQ